MKESNANINNPNIRFPVNLKKILSLYASQNKDERVISLETIVYCKRRKRKWKSSIGKIHRQITVAIVTPNALIFHAEAKNNEDHFSFLFEQSTVVAFLRLYSIAYRQQPSPLLYSIDIWPACNSRLTQRETNHYITGCTSVIAWSYLAGRLPEKIDLLA